MGACYGKDRNVSNPKASEVVAKNVAKSVEGAAAAVSGLFVSSDQLNKMVERCPAGSLRIFDSTFKPGEDCYLGFCKNHIKGAEFLDLGVVRDMTAPYPHTLPS